MKRLVALSFMGMTNQAQLAPELHAVQLSRAEIPLVDLTLPRAALVAALGAACREVGFFYITGHGVPAWQVTETFDTAKRFFAQPESVKAEIAIEHSAVHRGWFRVGGENLDPARQAQGDHKEGVKIGRDLGADHPLVRAGTPLHGPNQWPAMPGFCEVMTSYYEAMEALGRRLMGLFADSLGMPADFFAPWLTAPMTTLGPLHYPPQRGLITQAQIGAGAHTDFGCLTILAQDDVAGLQVLAKSGQWLAAPPLPGTFVVNIGDMMERWTNGVFTSTLHRVVNASGRERFSLPFFFDPDFAAPVACLPTCLAPGEMPKYPPTTAGAHLLAKIDESFAYHKAKPGG
jgi:isopenicillin N synthase-like dioxygenase